MQHAEERIAILETRTGMLEKVVVDLEKRMRSVEHTIWKAMGALAVLMLVKDVLIKKLM